MASKISFKVQLEDLVPPEEVAQLTNATKKEIHAELGEFIVDKILEDTSKQRSAVTGTQWKGLGWNNASKRYKKEKSKIAVGTANLELHGDMLDALKAIPHVDDVEVGIFTKLQAQKADGHCHHKVFGTSKLPVRKFLPYGDETLRSGILKQLAVVAKEAVENAPKKKTKSVLSLTKVMSSLIAKKG
jgi:hypothetical protein